MEVGEGRVGGRRDWWSEGVGREEGCGGLGVDGGESLIEGR